MAIPPNEGAQEAEWIRRVQAGDREPFGWLVERHQRRVFSLIYHVVRRRDEVEDIAQEAFVKAFQAIRSFNFQSSFRTWLARITVNHCYDYLRRERASRVRYFWQMGEEGRKKMEVRAERPPEDRHEDAGDRLAAKEFADQLLARAPADDRIILAMKELEDLSVEEIAEILDLNVSTVKVRLHRARKRMLEDWKKWRSKGPRPRSRTGV
jgi:RNA polymerase sigma-70 factor, ECF subfamily